ncbi:MAG: GIY-YIG nuclease family protein [Cyclobacteriaceae bacterium]
MGNFFTYITTNPRRTTLYTGMTNDLEQRIVEHYLLRGKPMTFAGQYYCYMLLFFERHHRAIHAIERETEIKAMSRKQKEELIALDNPKWRFLNSTIMQWPPHPDQHPDD